MTPKHPDEQDPRRVPDGRESDADRPDGDIPDGGQSFSVRVDRTLVRTTHHSSRFIVADIVAPPAPPARDGHERAPAHIAIVLDRSGSMHGEKFQLAREAVRQAIGRLGRRDRFSLVVYDDHIDVVMPTTEATDEARRTALERLALIDPRGSTDLCGGWLRGAEQVALHLETDGVNRILLLTDGLANVGVTDPDEIIRRVGELRARGIGTSTFGVGHDFNERLLEGMAAAGGGAFRYVEHAAQIPDHLSGEVGEALEVTARDVALEVTTAEGVRVESLTPWPLEARGHRTIIRIGDLVADQTTRVVLRVRFPLAETGREVGALVAATDRDGRLGTQARTITWTYANDRANDEQARDRSVDRIVARTFADRALSEAVALNRVGDYDGARRLINAVARRIKSYAGGDPVLRGIVDELEREAEAWATVRMEYERKAVYAQASYSLRMRASDGMAMRRKE
jgi:Ca-activated chloride channel family protein